MTARVRTTVEGERFVHKELWRIVMRQLEHSKKNPSGAFYDDLVAMVFAFHALEAYLNYVGDHLAPDIWKDERNFFRGEPYRGFGGKIKKVLELVGIPEPPRDVPPYSTIWLLKDLRDLMAHGKVEKYSGVIEHGDDEEPPLAQSTLNELITELNAQRAHDDVKFFAQQIHDLARPKVHDVWFGSHAFEGALQHGEGSSCIKT
ncbi:hypothetical protein LP415_21790 [Polaromonas sp. P1(28)-8]|nr:hypothetical protein LP415_21790 [Polaromonas sp. P1(28)-8]